MSAAGLANPGASYHCFLNVIVQSFWHIACVRSRLAALADHVCFKIGDGPPGSGCVVCQLRCTSAHTCLKFACKYYFVLNLGGVAADLLEAMATDAIAYPDDLRESLLHVTQGQFAAGACLRFKLCYIYEFKSILLECRCARRHNV